MQSYLVSAWVDQRPIVLFDETGSNNAVVRASNITVAAARAAKIAKGKVKRGRRIDELTVKVKKI